VAMSPTPVTPAATGRLWSIDALRGFDMFWIIGGDALFRALAKWANAPWSGVCREQLEHVDWDGFHFYDLIFPLFLFLVGSVIPFSLASARQRGASAAGLYARIIRRTLLLFALGLLYNSVLQLNWLVRADDGHWAVNLNDHLRVTGVLQRIAVCYGIAALIALNTGPRGQAVTVVAILLGYWALMTFVPNPETGVAGDLTKEGSLAGYVDRHYLPGRIMKEYYGYGDNEGLLSTIPAVATALLGVLTGEWLRSAASPARKVLGLAAAGAACLALGWLWSFAFPIVKNLWTSSFVLAAGGWSLLLLALFYGVIDALGWRAWAFFFVVIGANAITIYVGQRFIDFEKMALFFFGGAVRLSGTFGPVLAVAGALLLKWLFLLYLYRRGIFLRV
jgi:predicted acyltransferase